MADDLEEIRQQLAALDVEPFLLSTASTIASLAYAKLEAGDLDQAKKAIDALAALIPQLEGEFAEELQQALTALQVAYASAASG
ncbi:MAG TPA: hypothetical protein VGQ38_05775 [Gaiellaceae bacterium]|nr:hypothetical protein [Gaiellaceae bacterium]